MHITLIPYQFLQRFSSDFWVQREYNILFSNLGIVTLFLILKGSLISIMDQLPHFCLIDQLIGISCPFCGVTRGLCALADGNVAESLVLNASSLFVGLFFLLQIPLRIVTINRPYTREIINTFSKYLGYAVLIVIFMTWILQLYTNT